MKAIRIGPETRRDMVPEKPHEIPAATMRSIDRLLDRLRRDRESLTQNGYGDGSAPIESLNALANEADELKKALRPTAETNDGVCE